MNEIMASFIESHSKQSIDALIYGPLKPLLAKVSDEVCLKSIDCWKRAMMLIFQVQTHMLVLEWTRPASLIGVQYDENYMSLYRSQHGLEGHEEGKLVSFVMTPAIYIAGDENGKNYHTRRKLLDATVIV
jgi:hypothetical protein